MDREQLEIYARNPGVRRLLDFIARAEGADYNVGFGGYRFNSFDKHPNVQRQFTDLSGKKSTTTAAGRYQFINSTWKNLAKKYDLEDFSPHNQDLGAVALLAENGALNDAMHGNFDKAVGKINKVWASLPGSPHNQRTVSTQFMNAYFNNNRSTPTQFENMRSQAAINPLAFLQQVNQAEQDETGPQMPLVDLPEQANQTNETENTGPEGFGPAMPEQAIGGLDTNENALALANAPEAETDTAPAAPVAPTEAPIDMNAAPPSLSAQLAQAYGSEAGDFDFNSPAMLNDQADNIRNNAVSQFLGNGEPAPRLEIPRPMQNVINSIMTGMA